MIGPQDIWVALALGIFFFSSAQTGRKRAMKLALSGGTSA